MNAKRILAALLAALTLISCAACSESASGAETTAASSAAPETTVPTVTETTVDPNAPLDNLPADLKFSGMSFRTIQQNTILPCTTEEETGEIINDTLYARNRTVEERFEVDITPVRLEDYTAITGIISASVQAGSDDFDLVLGQMFRTANDALKGLFADWNKIPHIDLAQPWYTKSIQDAAVGDRLELINSDFCMAYCQQTWLMFFNKTKAKDYGLTENMYQIVNEGRWTIDMLNNLTKDVYADLNGDGTRDKEDFYGFAGTLGDCLLAAFMYGADTRLISLDENNVLSQPIMEERAVDLLTKMGALFVTNTGSMKHANALSATRRGLFPKGNYLFEAMMVADLTSTAMREFEDEFGVLPLPKYDEEQKEYYTVVDGGSDILTVLKTAQNTELIGAMVEALSSESYKTLIPVYCEIALEQKGTRDKESIEMLRNILDSRVIDFGYLYDGLAAWVPQLKTLVQRPGQIVSVQKKLGPSMLKKYQEVVDYFTVPVQ